MEPAAIAEPPVSDGVQTPQITVTPLDRASKDPIGLLPGTVTGLPRTMWSASPEDILVTLVRAERVDTLPAIQDFMKVLMLAEADPPLGAGPEGALFLARVDKLLDLAALDQAKALIEEATPDTPALFRRWFDVALLTGSEDDACDVIKNTPSIAPTYPARIFCLARNGDWSAAALTLNTHRVLGDINPQEEALLSRFLDPELYEDEPPLDPPDRVSPLTFRMHDAIGEPLITSTLPVAFAHADLRTTTAWKSQLEAVEKLARFDAISQNVLQDVYTARTPAASGGIWDRAEVFQTFDAAVATGDLAAIAQSLPPAWDAMRRARAEVPFAKLYGEPIYDLGLAGQAGEIAALVGFLSANYEDVALSAGAARANPFLAAIARGVPQEVAVSTPKELAIQSAFNGAPVPPVLQTLVDEGRLGEALLRAIAMFNAGFAGDSGAITDALALFRSVGLEDLARRASLQLMILERPT
ncbi:hypothetical protein [Yoonia sp. SS1-5]|uniref:Uncharacterized protein n=1 Tax=Yoonia rhodophyticola TaxID=3137370 RepID=A0AAN0MJF8_9RHOB